MDDAVATFATTARHSSSTGTGTSYSLLKSIILWGESVFDDWAGVMQ